MVILIGVLFSSGGVMSMVISRVLLVDISKVMLSRCRLLMISVVKFSISRNIRLGIMEKLSSVMFRL